MTDVKKEKIITAINTVTLDPRDGLSGKKRFDVLILFIMMTIVILMTAVIQYLIFKGLVFEMNTEIIKVRFGVDLSETKGILLTELPVKFLIQTLIAITLAYTGGQSASVMIKSSMLPAGEIKRMPYYKFVRLRVFIGAWFVIYVMVSILQLKSAPVELLNYGMTEAATGFGISILMYITSYVSPHLTEGIGGKPTTPPVTPTTVIGGVTIPAGGTNVDVPKVTVTLPEISDPNHVLTEEEMSGKIIAG